jgi:hypothetical protein
MKITKSKLISVIKEEIALLNESEYSFINKKSELNLIDYKDFNDKSGFRVNGSANFIDNENNDTIIRLTANNHQNGALVCDEDFSIGDDGKFNFEFDFKISNPSGLGDADGAGADGIKVELEGSEGKIGVFIDTFKNIEDESGNHIDLEINDENILQGYVNDKLNNGNAYKCIIKFVNGVLTINIENVDNNCGFQNEDDIENEDKESLGIPVIAYPINILKTLGGKKIKISFIGMTGSGSQLQDILTFYFSSRGDELVY